MSAGEPQSAHEAYLTRSHFSSLDGLRAISIVAVIWHHSSAGPGILGVGWRGVDLFFAISGFLITTLLLREHARTGAIDLRSFYIRRALRIFPLYYTVLVIYGAVWFFRWRGSAVGDGFVADLPAFATYTTNWFVGLEEDRGVLFYHSWSLATEEQFYLFWPLLLVLLLTLRRSLLLSVGAMGVLLVARVVLPNHLAISGSPAGTVLLSISVAICSGSLVALVLHSRRGFARVGPLLAHPLSLALVVAGVGILLWARPSSVAVEASMGLVVAACCVREDHALRPFLAWRPVAYVGRISYGMYLIHVLMIPVGALLGHRFLGTLGLTLLVASNSYTFFESPLLRLKSRFSSQRQTIQPAALPVAAIGEVRPVAGPA